MFKTYSIQLNNCSAFEVLGGNLAPYASFPAFLAPLASRRPNPVMYWRNGEGIESLVDSKFLS